VSVGRAPVQVVVPPRLVAALLLALAAGGAIGTNGAAQADACGDPIEGFIACPDLVLSDFAGSLSSDQRSVVLVGTVANTGRETSPDAVVRGFIARATPVTATTTIRSLKPGENTSVQVLVPIDDSMRERSVKIGLLVDPEDAIAEDDEQNNSDASSFRIPALPADLAVEAVSASLEDGNQVRVTFTVMNSGGAAPASTAVVKGGGASQTVDVGPLEPGGVEPLEATLAVSEDALGGVVTFSVTVDADQAVVEIDETNNVGRTQLSVPRLLANLVVASLTPKREPDSIVIEAVVRNDGDGPAAAAEVTASADGWTSATTETPQLQPGEQTTATLVLEIPDAERGRTATFEVLVDPEGRVEEGSEADNADSVEVFVPEAPVLLPDLALGPPTLVFGEGQLVVTLRVRNDGDGSAPPTLVEARIDGEPPVTEVVPALAAGGVADVELMLPVSDAEQGRELQILLIVDPADRVPEQVETNNVRRATTSVEIPDSGSWTVEITIGLGLLGALVLTVGGRAGLRARRRRGWERDAVESEEPSECRSSEWSRKLTLEPKRWIRRRITSLGLSSRRDPRRRRKVEGRLVEVLNEAVKRYRRRGDPDELRDPLTLVAEGLVAEIERWRDEPAADEIEVTCHLEGGKLSTKYERYECANGKPKKVEEWERDIEDEADEVLATVGYPLPDGPERSTRIAELVAELTAFCTGRVDVAPARQPEAPPVPRS